MQRTGEIKAAFERNARAVELRPSIGQGTATTKVRLREGLTAAHAEYLQSIEIYRRGSGYAVPGEFVVACGTRV